MAARRTNTSPEPRDALIADIGGTNVRFALVDASGESRETAVLKCRAFPGLAEAAESYLKAIAGAHRPRRGAFAVASPVTGDEISLTNNTWRFSIDALQTRLEFDALDVINDFTAVSLSVPHLGPEDRYAVPTGLDAPPDDLEAGVPFAVIGPGTGLGVSGLIPSASGWVPLATEGGHVTMPAMNEREADVLAVLRESYGHASAERVLSGPGLVNLYQALCRLDDRPIEKRMKPGVVAGRALDRTSPVCEEALAMFCAMLGTVAGDLCLSLGARRGLFIAGGIVPKLGDYFAASEFRPRFEAKGRFGTYLRPVPTHVMTHPLPAFAGLAYLVRTPRT